MDRHKEAESHVNIDPSFSEIGEPAALVSEKDGTTADMHDMIRMGKRQETTRNFRHITILGFCTVILSTWENILATAVFALANGGTAGLIWGYLICMICFGFVTASLAEMASM
jgi:choline transport protein